MKRGECLIGYKIVVYGTPVFAPVELRLAGATTVIKLVKLKFNVNSEACVSWAEFSSS
jgi:hypothetical protein